MLEIIKLYWKVYRLQIAIVVSIIIFGTNMLSSLWDSEEYIFLDSLIDSFMTLGFYLLLTPLFIVAYYFYKKQLQDNNPGYKEKMPNILNLDTFLTVYTLYATLGYFAGSIIKNVFVFE